LDQIKTVADAAAWVRRERNRQGWSAQDAAEKIREIAASTGDEISLTQQAISFFETGKAKSFPRWLRYFDLALAEAQVDERVALTSGVPEADNDDEVEIDSIDLSYGMGGTFVDVEPGALEIAKAKFSREWLRKFTHSSPELLFTTSGVGDSMAPTINDQDIVIVDRSEQLQGAMGDKIWAIVFGGVGMIKRLRPMPDGTVKIMSDNQAVRDELATDNDLFVIGRVVASVRRH
jgi:phage repressor protein C with HTH and peptisase S24 domain